MRYLSVTEIAKKWDVSERSVRNYCAQGRVNGAFLTGKTWNIPENVEKPERSNKKKEQPITLLVYSHAVCIYSKKCPCRTFLPSSLCSKGF